MKHHHEYFPFDALEHSAGITQSFLVVVAIYVLIFALSWSYVKIRG